MKQKVLRPGERPQADFVPVAPLHIADAFRSLQRGEATSYQQMVAMDWLLKQACGKAHPPYHPSDRDTAFALGRQFVAEIIIGFINADLSTLRREHVETQAPSTPT